MYRVWKPKKWIAAALAALLLLGPCLTGVFGETRPASLYAAREDEDGRVESYIKWVDFTPTCEAMQQAYQYDIASHESETPLNWIELLAYAAAKSGGKFSAKRNKDIDAAAEQCKNKTPVATLAADLKYYSYYLEAYTAVLGEYVGEYSIELPGKDDPETMEWRDVYGLKAFSPLAENYSFSHSDDFGNGRSYGYARKHLGHDMFGTVGTPVIAVEGGVIEVMGWNRYGGWRIGVRSLDGKRYYYYAHLRKGHPYNTTLKEGQIINPGEVIGYLGMTGYSTKEDTNNMKTPHLHFGIQLIFDESQKEGAAEIWIDAYEIVRFLQKNRATVVKNQDTGEYQRKYQVKYPAQ